MKELDLFGTTFECPCGRRHTIEPGEVVYGDDALERLSAVCARTTGGRNVAVLMDARTRAAAGADAAGALSRAGWRVTEVVVPDPTPGESPICDDVTRAAVEPRLGQADLILPAGAGVISDLGKWIACDAGLPFVCLATAASMNGYASSNIAPTLRGVKSLLYARPPAAVVALPAVLRDAPRELAASGLGDVLAKSVSSADWYLNHLFFGDYYCQRSVDLIGDIEPLYVDRPEDLSAGEPETMAALFVALLLTGAAMTMAGTSSPASGGEHLISHSLDMMSSMDGKAHDLHGRQVGLGTILGSEVYRRVLATESPRFVEMPRDVDRTFWGPLADVVAEQYAEKAPRLQAAREKLARGDVWDRLREAVAGMVRPPRKIRDCLVRAGAAHRAEDIGCDRARVLAALTHAHEMRSRFTVLDLAGLLGILPAAAEEIVEQWA